MKLIVALAIIIAACVAVWALGMFAQQKLQKSKPESHGLKHLGPYRAVWVTLPVACLLIGKVVYETAPESNLGVFLHTPQGPTIAIGAVLGTYFVGSLLFAALKVLKGRHGV